MIGLTDEERTTLERWRDGRYEGRAGDSPLFEVMCQLYARGLGVDVERDGPFGFGPYATITAAGEAALRADAEARAAGVWPCS